MNPVALVLPVAVCGMLSINDNRYDGLLIAIHPDVKEDRDILQQLSDMMSGASVYLYRATRDRAYFGSVNILIPETWQRDPTWKPSSSMTFDQAHVRVDKANPLQGNNPYTFQPQQCGEPGEYIHLTPEYVLDKDGKRTKTWGDAGRTMVHEFSHLRYGVFDEYGMGNQEHPNFYLDGEGMLSPNACPKKIRVGRYFESGKEVEQCRIYPETKLPGWNCTFVSDTEGVYVSASLMYDQAISKVFTFCESQSSDMGRRHNPLAPNRHNKLCNGKGTWDIVSKHPDFKGRNLPVSLRKSALKPHINFLYDVKTRLPGGELVCGRPVVLVIDLSTSMIGPKARYFKQSQTADKLIRDILPSGTMLGIVTFSTNASQLVPLTTLSTTQSRDSVAKKLPDVHKYGGGTGIGSGLLKAKEMLSKAGKTEEGRIILITDGEENQKPHVATMKKEITGTSLKVHAIAYSSAAAAAIKTLAEETGGKYAFYSESPDSTVLDSVMQTILFDISLCKTHSKIEILRKAELINPPRTASGQIEMDSTVGNDTMFVFTLPIGANVEVTLQGPDKRRYSSSSSEYSKDSDLNIIRFSFLKTEKGTWRYLLKYLGKRKFDTVTVKGMPTRRRGMLPGLTTRQPPSMRESVSVVVKSLPSSKEPYEVRTWLSSMTVDPTNKKPTIAYAHVHKGYSPVSSADVTATVERPKPAKPTKVKLKDDGKLPDNVASDGVYTAFFTEFSGNSRYSWDVDVRTEQSEDDLVKATFPKLATFSMALARYRNGTPQVSFQPTEIFTRTSSCGAMDVVGYKKGKDYFPPSRVTDLNIVKADPIKRTVMVTWTAPGDDLNNGQASSYEFRHLKDHSRYRHIDLKMTFLMGRPVRSRDLVKGTFKPKVGGSEEMMLLRVHGTAKHVYLALRTRDDAGFLSEVSNVATASFVQPKFAVKSPYVAPPTTMSTTSTTTSTTTTTKIYTTTTTTNIYTTTTTYTTSAITTETTTSQSTTTATSTAMGTSTNKELFKSSTTTVNSNTQPIDTMATNFVKLPTTAKQPPSSSQYMQKQVLEDPGPEPSRRPQSPDVVLIAVIVSSTVGLIIAVAIIAVVVSKLIVTRVHASPLTTSNIFSMQKFSPTDPKSFNP